MREKRKSTNEIVCRLDLYIIARSVNTKQTILLNHMILVPHLDLSKELVDSKSKEIHFYFYSYFYIFRFLKRNILPSHSVCHFVDNRLMREDPLFVICL